MSYGWEMSWAWPGLMQPISIFITPTSCAYDILDLSQLAKSTLFLSLSLHCCFLLSLCSLSLSLCHLLSHSSCSDLNPPPHLSGLRGHVSLTPYVISVCLSVNQPVYGLEVSVNLLRPMWRDCDTASPGKGHLYSAQKWICQHIQVPEERQCKYLILF